MIFTGGEPMLNQSAIIEILRHLGANGAAPKHVTIESNGTQPLRPEFAAALRDPMVLGGEMFWSISPKLSCSGERWDEAIRPTVVKEYASLSKIGQLKFVVDGSSQVWDEVKRATDAFRATGVHFPVWIMAVGALEQQQRELQQMICEEAIQRGYNFAARVHCWIWGNRVGT